VYGNPPPPEGDPLQRLFSTFPAGWPGVGLLMLRAAAGVVALVEGSTFAGAGTMAATAGVVLAASGASLLLGFLTPVASVAIGCVTAGARLSWFPAPLVSLFVDDLTVVLVTLIAVAVALLGPGAYSLDSYLFGRREIVLDARPRR
jgi:uncharacterized membrane protein YphA (DoxX/SURF4 family)